jgi:hypothetical protein
MKNELLGKLSSYSGNKQVIVKDQQVPDIITAMLSAHKIYAHEYDKISQDFYGGNAFQTAKNVFNYLKKNVKYHIESENNQKIMSPSAILSLEKNDCKNFALFIVGILDSLRRKGKIKNKTFYRFASYKLLDEIPHHVFAVMIDDNGEEIFIDPVLDYFNQRKTYYHKIDKTTNMPLYAISGIGATKKPKKLKKFILRISLAPARGSFLLLVGLNFLGQATKLKNAFTKNANKTKDWWEGLGGNANELLRKVEQGAKKKRLLGDEDNNSIGAIQFATIIAAATPVIIKLGEFLKSIGIDGKELVEVGKKVLAKTIKDVVAKKLENNQEIEEGSIQTIDEATGLSSRSKYIIPIVLAGGVIAYFILRKKR